MSAWFLERKALKALALAQRDAYRKARPYYTFTAQVGQGVQLRMVDMAGGTMNPTYVVYGPTGAPVTNSVSGTDVAAVVFATTSGTSTVIAYDATSGYASTGPYDLTFTLTPPG